MRSWRIAWNVAPDLGGLLGRQHALRERHLRQRVLRIGERREHAEILAVVGHRQEVERLTRKLDLEPTRVLDGLALGVAVGIVGRRPRVEDEGVAREAGVNVKIAEEGVAQRVGLRGGLLLRRRDRRFGLARASADTHRSNRQRQTADRRAT